VRWIGILGTVAVLIAPSADAFDPRRSCTGSAERMDAAEASPAGEPLPLIDDPCDVTKSEELRASLMRIPQEDENPVELSFGVKSNGGMLRLKIPFSF
jgi:hypothetical protein